MIWKWKLLSCIQLFAFAWPLESMEFTRPEYWSGKPLLSLGDFPNPGMKLRSPSLQADSLTVEPQGKPSVVWSQTTMTLRNAYKIYSISDDQQELEREIENARGRCRELSPAVRYMDIRFLGIRHDLEIRSFIILTLMQEIQCMWFWWSRIMVIMRLFV